MQLLWDLAFSIVMIALGRTLILYESAWSWKYRTRIEFVKSPYREIFGALIIAWSIVYLVISIRHYLSETESPKKIAKDAFWRFLLYPLENSSSPKPVFIPLERGPNWSWGAFIIPEVWFLWHEIWGASILALIAEIVAIQVIKPQGFGLYVAIAGVLSVRIFAGLWGNRVYYFRFGKWLRSSSNQVARPDR
jgi:hypothetical protein